LAEAKAPENSKIAKTKSRRERREDRPVFVVDIICTGLKCRKIKGQIAIKN
jgi:hypothetical protein